jgi:hypothetical protein
MYMRAWKVGDLAGHVDPEGSSLFMKVAGMSLAAGSVAFAGHMISTRDHASTAAKSAGAALITWHKGTGVLGPFDNMPTSTVLNQEVVPPNLVTEVGGSPYIVRAANAESAFVEGPKGLVTEVKPGTTLPNAGRVLSIERRATGWVVVTTLRTIQ